MARPSTRVLKQRIRGAIVRFKGKPCLGDFLSFNSGRSQKVSSAQMRRYGKPFLGAFNPLQFSFQGREFKVSLAHTMYESPIGIEIGILKDDLSVSLGAVKLGFARGAVLVEAVQGAKGAVKDLKRFERAVGLPCPIF